jgi:hypothetical protein
MTEGVDYTIINNDTVVFVETPLVDMNINIIYSYYKELSLFLGDFYNYTQIEVADGSTTVWNLDFEDIERLTVYVEGVFLTEGEDFVYDKENNVITLTEAVRVDANINFHYYVRRV